MSPSLLAPAGLHRNAKAILTDRWPHFSHPAHITPRGLRQGRPRFVVSCWRWSLLCSHLRAQLYPTNGVEKHWERSLLIFSSLLLLSEMFCFSINSSKPAAIYILLQKCFSPGDLSTAASQLDLEGRHQRKAAFSPTVPLSTPLGADTARFHLWVCL